MAEAEKALLAKAHEAQFKAAYQDYLRAQALELEKHPNLVQEFEDLRADQAASIRKMGINPEKIMTDDERIEAIADHFKTHKRFKVLTFWEWDLQMNPQRLTLRNKETTAHPQPRAA